MATNLAVNPGDDLFRIAAENYGDATAWTLIVFANPGLPADPVIQTSGVIVIPAYNSGRANNGIPISQ